MAHELPVHFILIHPTSPASPHRLPLCSDIARVERQFWRAARRASYRAGRMRIDHIEVSIPRGTLRAGFCDDLDQLLVDILGWSAETKEFIHPLDGVLRRERTYLLPNGQFVVLSEADSYCEDETDDHFGIVVSSDDLDRIFDACRKLQEHDDRLELRYVIDDKPSVVDIGPVLLRAIFVRYLFPRWIDIQSRDAK